MCLENMFKGVRCDLDKIHPMGFDALLSVVARRMHLGNPTIRDESAGLRAPNSITHLHGGTHFLYPAPSQLLDMAGREKQAHF